jgi:hypothetical protein
MTESGRAASRLLANSAEKRSCGFGDDAGLTCLTYATPTHSVDRLPRFARTRNSWDVPTVQGSSPLERV